MKYMGEASYVLGFRIVKNLWRDFQFIPKGILSKVPKISWVWRVYNSKPTDIHNLKPMGLP